MKSKAKPGKILMSEWLSVMERVAQEEQQPAPGFKSIAQLCEEFHVKESAMRARMRIAKAKGLVESVHLRRLDCFGRPQRVPYYRPITKPAP